MDDAESAPLATGGGHREDGESGHRERVNAHGHEHVSAEHASTFEVTTDEFLTPAGDCILATEADRAPADFADPFVTACRDAAARIEATITVGDPNDPDHEVTVAGRGHPDLTFESDRGAVARTSGYVDDRTVMIGAEAAAADLPRGLVDALAEGDDLTLTLRVDPA